jgi:hypothetical protein
VRNQFLVAEFLDSCVHFLDQFSDRDNCGFADQLLDGQ